MKKQAAMVALLLTGILVVSLGLTALTYEPPAGTGGDLTVTAAFFPLYTAALQVVGETDGVTVQCLTEPTAGCMHDYQLSPDEMAALSAADILVLNGSGAESFLDQALTALPDLRTVDTSAGVDALEICDDHDHDHEHEQDHDHGSVNEHTWLSPARYAKQVENLRDGLCAADPDRAALYTANAAAYLDRIAAVQREWDALTADWDGAVLFHDSVAYVADDLGLPVLAALPVGDDHGLSAGDLTAAIGAVSGKRVLLLFDGQYPVDALSLDTYAAQAAAVVLDIAARPQTGGNAADAWLTAMGANIQAIKEATA